MVSHMDIPNQRQFAVWGFALLEDCGVWWVVFANKYYRMMMAEGEEKRLVESFKATNRQLRKQLQNLNSEIDKIISFKTNRIGLKKLPPVDKSLLKTNDVKLLQVEVDNLRKRLELLVKDSEGVGEKVKVNYMERAKELEVQLAQKKLEKEALKKQVYQTDRRIQELNTTDIVNEEMRLYDRIEQLNQELIRTKKIQAELMKDIEEKRRNETKKTDYIHQSVEHHKEVVKEVSAAQASRIEMPVTYGKSKVNDQEWKNLKKEFLELKDSKQHEETQLNEENDRLRGEIRALELRMKQKKSTIENIRSLEIRRKERNYSTLDQSVPASSKDKDDSFRYRNRNNAYKYNTKQ